MPVVNENQIVDHPGSSRHDMHLGNRYGKGGKASRKSEATSPDLMWTASEIFHCLESLGANVTKDSAPYDRISYSESSFDRVSRVLIVFFCIWGLFRGYHFILDEVCMNFTS